MSEPRTIREARLAVREIERAVDAVRMSPAAALGRGMMTGWRLRAIQAKLRQVEREMAKADDPRLEVLKPLSPHVEPPRRPRGPRRRRYRCETCFSEQLTYPQEIEREPAHCRLRPAEGGYERVYCGEWQPISPLRTKRP